MAHNNNNYPVSAHASSSSGSSSGGCNNNSNNNNQIALHTGQTNPESLRQAAHDLSRQTLTTNACTSLSK